MTEIVKREGTVQQSHGGKHEDWNGVDTACLTVAHEQIWNLLHDDPQTAFVAVNGRTQAIKEHGLKQIFNGFEKWEKEYEHAHHDSAKPGRSGPHWEGTRRYAYVALIEVSHI